jgi:DNA repair protein RecO (recombination protein O)
MGLFNTKAIVLRSINLSETDKLVTFMTVNFGKVKCVAKGARKIKSRNQAALMPMSCIQLIYFGKETQTLYRLNHSDIIESFQSVRDDFNKLYTGIYFAELVDALVPEASREIKIYHLLLNALQALKNMNNLEPLLRLFEMQFLALSGYHPEMQHCVFCKSFKDTGKVGFSYRNRGIVCQPCSSRHPVDEQFHTGTLNYLKKLLSLDIQHSGRLKFPKGLSEEIGNITHRLVLAQSGRELKSYPFIKSMAKWA